MRAMLCGCGRRLVAATDHELVHEALIHGSQGRATCATDEGIVSRVVEKNAYGLEYTAPYADGEGPDEEFGPEPY